MPKFTPLQRMIMQGVMEGLTNAQIRTTVNLPPGTSVAKELTTIRKLCGCRSRTGVAVYYAERVLSNRQRDALRRSPEVRKFRGSVVRLTTTMRHLLDAIADAPELTNAEIGARLGVGKKTVEMRVSHILNRCLVSGKFVRLRLVVLRRLTRGSNQL